MVTVASPASAALASRLGWRGVGWLAAAVGVLIVGATVRLVLDSGAGGRSAAVMLVLLGLAAWVVTVLLSTPRRALLVTLGATALLVIAALPPRHAPDYDDRQAYFAVDQVVTARVHPGSGGVTRPVLTLLVEPSFVGRQPAFGLAGETGGVKLAWDCAFRRGMQRLALPLPPAVTGGATEIEVRLQLTGSPTRESDYLLVYTSSARGGLLASIVDAAEIAETATLCGLR